MDLHDLRKAMWKDRDAKQRRTFEWAKDNEEEIVRPAQGQGFEGHDRALSPVVWLALGQPQPPGSPGTTETPQETPAGGSPMTPAEAESTTKPPPQAPAPPTTSAATPQPGEDDAQRGPDPPSSLTGVHTQADSAPGTTPALDQAFPPPSAKLPAATSPKGLIVDQHAEEHWQTSTTRPNDGTVTKEETAPTVG